MIKRWRRSLRLSPRTQKKTMSEADPPESPKPDDDADREQPRSSLSSRTLSQKAFGIDFNPESDFYLDIEQVTIAQRIGGGEFSDVFVGEYFGDKVRRRATHPATPAAARLFLRHARQHGIGRSRAYARLGRRSSPAPSPPSPNPCAAPVAERPSSRH